MGGSVALVAGTLRPLGAAVTYYGGGVAEGRFGFSPLADLAPTLVSPWLGHFGDLDKGIPVEQVEALRRAAAGAAVETEIYRYADARPRVQLRRPAQRVQPGGQRRGVDADAGLV